MKYTYFIHRPSDGMTKIGRSTNPQLRLETLGPKGTLNVIKVIEGDVEHKTHREFAEYRRTGEWFALPQAIVDQLSEPVSMPRVGKRVTIVFEDPQLSRIEEHARKNKWSFGQAVRDLVENPKPKKKP